MKLTEMIGPLMILGFIIVAMTIGIYLSSPRKVIVDGIPCVIAGYGERMSIDCQWPNK